MSRPRNRANGEGSIYPYRNGFAAYVWVTKPNGKKARKYVYGKTRDEVHDKWVKLQTKARKGPVATKVPKVADYSIGWLEEVVRPNLAPTTYTKYESFTRLHITPGLGGKNVDRLSARDVQTWLNKLTVTCQCCAQGKDARRPEKRQRCCALTPKQCCREVLSPGTIRSIRECLRSMLSAAITDELTDRNVAALAKLPHGRARKAKAWTSDQARTFLESARADRDPLYAAYVLVLVLGLRKGEVLGLLWDFVDLATGEVNIVKQLQRISRKLMLRPVKTDASEAPLPMPDLCVTALNLRRQRQQLDKAAAGDMWEASTLRFVFTSRHGAPVDPRNFNRSFTRRCRKAGVPTITVHDARRTCGTLLAALDVHPRVAMEILRHAKFSLTMEIYTQVSSEQTREALKRLGESLKNGESAPEPDDHDDASEAA